MTDQESIDTTATTLLPTTKRWFPAMDTRTYIVCWMMMSSFVLVVLCWWKPPAADNQIVSMLVSVYVSTGFVTALQWWMGSSKGSEDKNTIIASK